VALQPQSKAKIDILEVAEITLVETADHVEGGSIVESCRCAGGKHFPVTRRPLAIGHEMTIPPCPTAGVVTVSRPVQSFRLGVEQQSTRVCPSLRLSLRSLE